MIISYASNHYLTFIPISKSHLRSFSTMIKKFRHLSHNPKSKQITTNLHYGNLFVYIFTQEAEWIKRESGSKMKNHASAPHEEVKGGNSAKY